MVLVSRHQMQQCWEFILQTNPSHTPNLKLQLLLHIAGIKCSSCEGNSNDKSFNKPFKLATNYSHNSFYLCTFIHVHIRASSHL